MSFPEVERVIYQKNPLEEVLCQLRFPAILRIGAENPVDFQDKIRREYPIFDPDIAQTNIFPKEIVQQLPPAILSSLVKNVGQTYRFISSDGHWTVSLTQEFLALTTTRYERWEEFRDHLVTPLTALVEVYEPAFYSRIGLRYRNVIRRSKLGLENENWANLLQPHIACELASNLRDAVREAVHNILIELNEGEVRIRHGLAKDEVTNEELYLLDSDFFTHERTELKDGRAILDRFNQNTRKLFRWCITEQLHQAMEPKSI